MIKLLFDNQIFVSQSSGGISRLFAELYQHFTLSQSDINVSMPFSFGDNVYAKNVGIRQREFFIKQRFRGKMRIQTTIAKSLTIPKLLSRRFDLFHPTYYDPYFIKYLGKKPFVLTVFDMMHEIYAEKYFQQDRTTSAQKRYLVNRACRIIAISKSTKNDLIRLFGVNPEIVDVIYLGNSLQITAHKKLPRCIDQQRYLLFIGSRQVYKNFLIFFKAVIPLLKKYDDIKVVCIGGGPFNSQELGMLEKFGVSNKFIQRFIPDDELASYYQNALAFVFPSLYEGFGIPLLEAFASGCPVIASDIPVFHEVAGSAALYFDPLNENDLKTQTEKLLTGQSLREKFIVQGYEQLKKYSWENTARMTKETYMKVLGI
jgi:glycosyltransferase involved in cell wall biosynthesis